MGSLWVDKYRPRDFLKLTYHFEQSNKLAKLVDLGDFPHILFCGPSGAGKRTRIYCLLKKLYGCGAENVRLDFHEFLTPSGKKLQIHVMNSNYHIELTPSDVGIYDRIIVQEIVKEMAKVQQINRTSQKSFKVVVLMEAENLSRDAQHALRRTMEKYASTCKIILCCESSSRIIDPLRSRCMIIRVPSPNNFEVKNCILDVCTKEKIKISNELLNKMVDKSNGNVRRALLLLEGTISQHGFDLNNQTLCEPEWETFLRETAKLAKSKQTSEGIIDIRQRFYELLCRCISAQVVFVKFTEELIKICDPSLMMQLISAAAKYEHSSKLGSKPIYHLEALVATFMDLSTSFKASLV